MGIVAELCETRFEALLKEPHGNELLSAHLPLHGPDFQHLHKHLPPKVTGDIGIGSEVVETGSTAAHHEPFLLPEPEPAYCRDG
jgi:hypothetical protein